MHLMLGTVHFRVDIVKKKSFGESTRPYVRFFSFHPDISQPPVSFFHFSPKKFHIPHLRTYRYSRLTSSLQCLPHPPYLSPHPQHVVASLPSAVYNTFSTHTYEKLAWGSMSPSTYGTQYSSLTCSASFGRGLAQMILLCWQSRIFSPDISRFFEHLNGTGRSRTLNRDLYLNMSKIARDQGPKKTLAYKILSYYFIFHCNERSQQNHMSLQQHFCSNLRI